jgi:hypothetical protein
MLALDAVYDFIKDPGTWDELYVDVGISACARASVSVMGNELGETTNDRRKPAPNSDC